MELPLNARDLAAHLSELPTAADGDDLHAARTAVQDELAALDEAVKEVYRTIARQAMGALPRPGHRSERRVERAVALLIQRAVSDTLEDEIETGERIRAEG